METARDLNKVKPPNFGVNESGALQVSCLSEKLLGVECYSERENHCLQGCGMVSYALVDSPTPMYMWAALIALSVLSKNEVLQEMGYLVRDTEGP